MNTHYLYLSDPRNAKRVKNMLKMSALPNKKSDPHNLCPNLFRLQLGEWVLDNLLKWRKDVALM